MVPSQPKFQRVALLTREEEIDLAARCHKGDRAARDELITHNFGLVKLIAGRYHRPEQVDALVSAGNLGLIEAAERFDPFQHRNKFCTYASYWIKREMRDWLRADQSVRIPAYQHARRAQHRRDPEQGKPAGDLDRAADRACQAPTSFAIDDDRIDDGRPSAATLFQAQEDREVLAAAMRELSDVEQYVIAHRFGLAGGAPEKRLAISTHFGLTAEWTRKVEKKALAKLRLILTRDPHRGADAAPHCAFGKKSNPNVKKT
jgi:RNA polymerase primary sigma factor